MNSSIARLWERFTQYYSEYPVVGLGVDLNRMSFADDFIALVEPQIRKARQVRPRWGASLQIWDWVGGRTSDLPAIGLLPAALHGLNGNELIRGAQSCVEIARNPNTRVDRTAQSSGMPYRTGNDLSDVDTLILPSKVSA